MRFDDSFKFRLDISLLATQPLQGSPGALLLSSRHVPAWSFRNQEHQNQEWHRKGATEKRECGPIQIFAGHEAKQDAYVTESRRKKAERSANLWLDGFAQVHGQWQWSDTNAESR